MYTLQQNIIRYSLCVWEGIRTVGSPRMHDAYRRRNLRGRRLSLPREEVGCVCSVNVGGD